ncbi:MAG: hypothetical protein RLZZ611_876 [Cyanobacteriota bacterium]
MIQKEGPGWRLAWDEARHPFAVLIGGDGWAAELTVMEAEALRLALAELVAQHGSLVDQLMAEEAISLELEREPWWLEIEGDRAGWSLRVMLIPQAGQRAFEGAWCHPASRGFSEALQLLHGQP